MRYMLLLGVVCAVSFGLGSQFGPRWPAQLGDPIVVTLPDETRPGERRSVFLQITDVSTYEQGTKEPPGEFKRVPEDWMFRMGSTDHPYYIIAKPTLPPRSPMDPPR